MRLACLSTVLTVAILAILLAFGVPTWLAFLLAFGTTFLVVGGIRLVPPWLELRAARNAESARLYVLPTARERQARPPHAPAPPPHAPEGGG